MEYYHDIVTQKSFQLLQALRKKYEFILIGGWAVFLFTKSLKSKDIDIVVDFSELEKLRNDYQMVKNERLKKYEIKIEGIDVDIYATHYSNPGLPAEEISKYKTAREGFAVLGPEILLILKQYAYSQRQGTPKGEKDKIDIISLLQYQDFDFGAYSKILKQYEMKNYTNDLKRLLENIRAVKELNLNSHQFSRLKKQILSQLLKNGDLVK